MNSNHECTGNCQYCFEPCVDYQDGCVCEKHSDPWYDCGCSMCGGWDEELE